MREFLISALYFFTGFALGTNLMAYAAGMSPWM